MKKLLILSCLFGISFLTSAQNYLHLNGGYSIMNPKEWNKTIATYNFTRPWLKNELTTLHRDWSYGLGYSGVIARGMFISPEANYTKFTSQSTNENINTTIKLNWLRGSLYLDLYPLEFNLDSVGFKTRPFVRLGGGATCLLPRITQNDSLTTVDDEPYNPVIWSYQLTGGVGCRFYLAKHIDLIPMVLYHYQPKVNLEDFSYALHGSRLPGLVDEQKLSTIQFFLTLSIRLGRNEEETR